MKPFKTQGNASNPASPCAKPPTGFAVCFAGTIAEASHRLPALAAAALCALATAGAATERTVGADLRVRPEHDAPATPAAAPARTGGPACPPSAAPAAAPAAPAPAPATPATNTQTGLSVLPNSPAATRATPTPPWAVEFWFNSGIAYIRPTWHEATDFKRIAEYFTGKEVMDGDYITRSDASNRAGMYFHVGFSPGFRSAPALNIPPRSTVVLEYIHSEAQTVNTRTFDLSAMPDGLFAELRVGLTGADWPNKNRQLVAWRLSIRDIRGTVIARKQSFLWSLGETEPKKTTKSEIGK